jgi:hypothetical protein
MPIDRDGPPSGAIVTIVQLRGFSGIHLAPSKKGFAREFRVNNPDALGRHDLLSAVYYRNWAYSRGFNSLGYRQIPDVGRLGIYLCLGYPGSHYLMSELADGEEAAAVRELRPTF